MVVLRRLRRCGLGVNENPLWNWCKAERDGRLRGATAPKVTPEQMALSRVRAENARLKMELEILKKLRRTLPRNHCEVRLD
jgi:transposase-like protein